MTRSLTICALVACAVVATPARADETKTSLSGRWVVTSSIYGIPRFDIMELTQAGSKLTGNFGGDVLEGTIQGDAVAFHAQDAQGGTEDVKATLANGAISGSIVFRFDGDLNNPIDTTFTATRGGTRPKGPPRRHDFTPSVFYREFSAQTKPVLTIGAGDTIRTTTVDAGGSDAKGIRRSAGGNPETGPFYVDGVVPGDTLVVHLVKVRLNRDYAISDDGIVPRALNGDLAVTMKDNGQNVRWHLDLAKGVATSEKPGDHLGRYTVPLRPMLGCLAVAPGPGQAAPGTGDSGTWGGNMDFNELVEGTTAYLPVRNPGALLYFGDGHAAQGDGELNGNALETSLDVELTVDVISGKHIPAVRIESPTHIIAMGLDGSLDGAFRDATANMARWLAEDYKLTPSEVAQIFGTAAEYRVSEVADRNAGMVLKISKERLRGLAPPAK
jgi:amidase